MPAYGVLIERVTSAPVVRFGKPFIRGHRITVPEILAWLSNGASQDEILADYPPNLNLRISSRSMLMPRSWRQAARSLEA